MNIEDLTIGQAREIAAQFGSLASPSPVTATVSDGALIPVVVCTDKRGVVFGYTTNPTARPITLTTARMCLYWSADVGGVFGLAENGPTKDCQISATAPSLSLEGVTAVFSVDAAAEKAWAKAPVQGR